MVTLYIVSVGVLRYIKFAATTGGIWGLFFGMSCVSLVEILVLLWRMARTFARRCGGGAEGGQDRRGLRA